MTLETRPIAESELPEWLRALNSGFLMAPTPTEQDIERWRARADLSRTVGAFDGDRCVATFRTFAQRLTVVGGATVAANAVTNVTVSATHRRRGLLSRMMTEDLAAAKERGDLVATLNSAEYPIYGRYGFGPAAWTTEWAVDVLRTGLDPRRPVPSDGGRIDLVDAAEARTLGPEIHSRLAARQPGIVGRDERWWKLLTGVLRSSVHPWTEPFYAVYRSASGEPEGIVVYSSDGKWSDAQQPQNTLTVRDLLALTPAAERALWHYLCSIDWATTVKTGQRPCDDLLPLLLPDPRAARPLAVADYLWLRVLDVVGALEARTYGSAASLVLDLKDDLGHTSGRYRLDASPTGAACAPTTAPADLTMDVRELGALYLGDASPVRLAALGTLTENREGAVGEAEKVFRTARRPWCPDEF